MLMQLGSDRDVMWEALDRKVRNQVRKAEKSGLTCQTGGAELLDQFLAQGQGTSPFVAGTNNHFAPVSAAGLTTYTTANAVLTDSAAQPVVDTNPDDFQAAQQYQNGVMSGRLFANLSDAVCPDNATPADYCDYQVNSASVYYMWQTGPGNFNQFAAIKDSSGAFVHGETGPPTGLQLSSRH